MIDLSPLKKIFKDKPLAVLGLGKSGMPVVEACAKAGIETVLWDDGEAARTMAGGNLVDFSSLDFSTVAALCVSPGIPLTHPKPHPAVLRARDAGIPILGDVELFYMARPDVRTIGITGTNGKSTTTALIGHILQNAGIPCAVGGNIGEAILTLPQLPPQSTYVLELSSYQLDLCPTFAPDIAVLANLSPDHLDRHGSMEGYAAAKERIFRGVGTAIIGIDDEPSHKIEERTRHNAKRKTVAISCLRPLMHGVYASADGILFDGPDKILDLHTCRTLQGVHNWQNAALAYTAARAAGVAVADIVRGLHSFPGLAHRQHMITVHNGITYINDSKATNDQAASVALRTFAPIYWIAGGKPKEGGYALCSKYLDHVRHAFLIGEAQDAMAAWLKGKRIPHTVCNTLDRATEAAHHLAEQEKLTHATVLLSPACASFDQFRNFEHRGTEFENIVKRLTRPAIGAYAS